MGNIGSNSRRHHSNHHQHQRSPSASQSQITTNQYVFTAPSQYPNPNLPHHYHQYPPGYHPPQPYDYHRCPSGAASLAVEPCVERQKTVTIKNDVNIKKETIRVVEDEENPAKFLLTFTFDATAPGR